MMRTTLIAIGMAITSGAARAQSLFERPVQPAVTANGGLAQPDSTSTLRAVSLFAVVPPAPRTYAKNDLIEIIINESSLQKHEQSLDTKKDYQISAALKQFPSLRHLIELQLQNGDSQRSAELDIESKSDYKGDGQYERKDRFTARITATVLEVKPNGTLVLEARKSVKSNSEEAAIVLSGLCRPDDVSKNNTVQSSQLANLTLTVVNSGDVRDSARKGLIPKVLETIFNF